MERGIQTKEAPRTGTARMYRSLAALALLPSCLLAGCSYSSETNSSPTSSSEVTDIQNTQTSSEQEETTSNTDTASADVFGPKNFMYATRNISEGYIRDVMGEDSYRDRNAYLTMEFCHDGKITVIETEKPYTLDNDDFNPDGSYKISQVWQTKERIITGNYPGELWYVNSKSSPESVCNNTLYDFKESTTKDSLGYTVKKSQICVPDIEDHEKREGSELVIEKTTDDPRFPEGLTSVHMRYNPECYRVGD